MRPAPAASRLDVPRVELGRNGVCAPDATFLYLSDDRQYIGRKLPRSGFASLGTEPLGPLPSFFPRALAACRAALVRSEIISRSC
jgi:hypothetical protein